MSVHSSVSLTKFLALMLFLPIGVLILLAAFFAVPYSETQLVTASSGEVVLAYSLLAIIKTSNKFKQSLVPLASVIGGTLVVEFFLFLLQIFQAILVVTTIVTIELLFTIVYTMSLIYAFVRGPH